MNINHLLQWHGFTIGTEGYFKVEVKTLHSAGTTFSAIVRGQEVHRANVNNCICFRFRTEQVLTQNILETCNGF